MKATVVNKRGVTVISLEGYMNYAHPLRFKEEIKKVYASKRNQKIIFNLSNLQFIGSSGLKQFVDVLNELNKTRTRPRFIGVSDEFQKLFKAFQGKRRFQVYSDEREAIQSYRMVKKPAHA